MSHKNLNCRSGVASFYIVAISTLILVVLATSFATAILAEIIRSSNDELAQSAYDSAMAGVEEAKLAYTNYRNCININPSLEETSTSLDLSTDDATCQDIVYWIQHPDCDMVAHILGRIGKREAGEVSLEQTSIGKTSDLDQAYTCVTIDPYPSNEVGTLDSANPYKIAKLKTNIAAKVDSITLKWYMNDDDLDFSYTNIIDDQVVFGPANKIDIPIPPTISFSIVQAPNTGFTFNQLNGTSDSDSNTTDRATMVFVPTGNIDVAKASNPVTSSSTYVGIYDESLDDGTNYLSASQIVGTNSHDKNYPYAVYCDKQDDYACSVRIELPKPIDGDKRSDEVFAFVVSLPYGNPRTTFSIDFNFTCDGGDTCKLTNEYKNNGSNIVIDTSQVVIDSTGRAGDMYKRVEVRLATEVSADLNGYPFFAIQADSINKNFSVDNEWGIDNDPPIPTPDPEPNCTDSMQDWDDVASLRVNDTIYLRDERDKQCYSVAKLEDGKVWMTESLNLAGGTQLTANDTDMPPGYTLPIDYKFQSNNRLPDSFSIGYPKATDAIVYNSGNRTCYTGEGYTVANIPCYSYYSYTTITLGSGVGLAKDTSAPYSICPKGWRLPVAGYYTNWDNGDFYTLFVAYGGNPEENSGNGHFKQQWSVFEKIGPGTAANYVNTGWVIFFPRDNGTSSIGVSPNSSGWSFYYSATSTGPWDDGLNIGVTNILRIKDGVIDMGQSFGELIGGNSYAAKFVAQVRCIKR